MEMLGEVTGRSLLAYGVIVAVGIVCIYLACRRALSYEVMLGAGVTTVAIDGLVLNVPPLWLAMDVAFTLYPLVRIVLRARR